MAYEDYQLGFDEINQLTEATYNVSKGNVEQMKDDVYNMLINAYIHGIDCVSDMLDYPIEVQIELIDNCIFEEIDSEDVFDRVEKYKDDITALQRLTRSEYHRVYNNAMADGATTFKSVTGSDVYKDGSLWVMRELGIHTTHCMGLWWA